MCSIVCIDTGLGREDAFFELVLFVLAPATVFLLLFYQLGSLLFCAGAGGSEVSSGSAVSLSSTASGGQSQVAAGIGTLSP